MTELPPSLTSLAEIVRWRADAHGDRSAFAFLANGESESGSLTYAALDRRARAIAGFLQERAPGEPVLLCFPSGLEFVAAFVACFYAGCLAIPAYPPRNRRHVSRIRAIVADSRVRLVLATGSAVEEIRSWLPSEGAASAEVVDPRSIADDVASQWKPIISRPGDLAYLQYTSGSTSTPKGVMVSHDNLRRNGEAIRDGFALHPESRTVSWLPLFHDMGLVLTLVVPLITGTPVVMMTPAAFVQRPLRWLEAVSRYRATHSGGPNFAFDLAVERTTPEQRERLELSAWETCYNGSEPVRKSTLDRFNAAFAVSGFSPRTQAPAYGLAEATLLVSSKRRGRAVESRALRGAELQRHRVAAARAGEAGAIDIVGCGPPVIDTTVVLVDPQTRLRVPPGAVGEIWMQAPGVALGYWKNPEATRETFGARLAESGEGPFLRTGDLGFFEDGELYIAGRIKDMMILRGRNHYPHDIELTVQESHGAVERGSAVAFGVAIEDEERLVIVQEVSRTSLRDLDPEATLAAIRQAVVEEHEVEIRELLLVAPLEVPKTSSGKIQRSEARDRYLADAFKVLARYRAPVAIEVPADSTPEAAANAHPAEDERRRSIERWLVARLAALQGMALSEVDASRPFASFGIDSILAVRICGELEEWLARSLSPTLLYEYPNARSLATHLARPEPATRKQANAESASEPIAIVGIGCRFPGAGSPEEFWDALSRGADLVAEAPTERGLRAVRLADLPAAGSLRGGFLNEVDLFDAEFFGIAPREASDLDPQQRLLLEVAWAALEDAGIAPNRLAGTDTGVFVGLSTRDYAELLAASGAGGPGPYYGTGTAASAAAGRLSYVLGLEGPSLVIDTACSSSLVAVHLATQSLRSGECRIALAGGVNLVLSPHLNEALARARMLSPSGRCHTFAADADGYVRGEGCAIVVLKRLRDALFDGDRIHAVVRGTAINQDGRTNGLTAPSGAAQERVVRAALESAGIDPGEVGYIEAHGTGTPLGDPIEVQALARVFGKRDASFPTAYLGSVKTNIGHLEAAAGAAGLVKAALAVEHGEIPPHLHFDQPSPMIAWESLPFEVPRGMRAWPGGRARRIAGVSSFGFVGTNAHVVLEAAPQALARAPDPPRHPMGHVLCISARSPPALDQLSDAYASLARSSPALDPSDLCASAAVGRTHWRHRLALVADSTAELGTGLEAVLAGEKAAPACSVHRGEVAPGEDKRVVFLFTGQGSQYPGMARGLYASEPAYRRALDQCAEALRPHMAADLLSVLHPRSDDDGRIDQTEFTQPALFAIEWSLAQMWRSWGVVPAALIGHSIGEIAAACIAGVFTLEEAAALVAARGKAMQSLQPGGAMAAAAANEKTVAEAIADCGEAVAIAAVNAPSQCVISGEAGAVAAACVRLAARGVACEPLNVSHAFHSPLMRPALGAIEAALARVAFRTPHSPIYANLHGRAAKPGELEAAAYWVRQVQGTIRFDACIAAAIEDGFTTFLEVGPHPTLAALSRQQPGARERKWIASLRRGKEDRRQVAEAQAALYTAGVDLDWQAVYRDTPRAFVSLPRYPFQRQRFWMDAAVAPAETRATALIAGDGRHPLLGDRVPIGSPRQRAWLRSIDLETSPWLSDHQVDAAIVYPGTAFIEVAMVAAREALGTNDVELSGIVFRQPLVLHAGIPFTLQAHVQCDGSEASVAIYSRPARAGGDWVCHCSMRADASHARDESDVEAVEAVRARCARSIAPAAFYEGWRERGNRWGSTFQGIARLEVGRDEAIALIETPASIAVDGDVHPAHPAIVDACVQVLAAAVGEHRRGAFVGKAVGRVRLHAPLGGGPLWSHAVLHEDRAVRSRAIGGDVRVRDRDGRVVAELLDVSFEFIELARGSARGPEHWLNAVEWIELERPAVAAAPGHWVIAYGDETRDAAAMLAQALADRGQRARLVSVDGGAADDARGVAKRLSLLLDAARELVRGGAGEAARLLVLTRGAWSLTGDAPAAPVLHGAATWGLGRTLAAEHREISSVLVDLAPADPLAGLDALAAQVCAGSAEDQLAVRGSTVFAPRLKRICAKRSEPPRLRADSTYVVTGGLGVLGLRVARWLVEHGCRHLVLMGRTALPPRAQWSQVDSANTAGRRIAAIVAMEAFGAAVRAVVLDVSDAAALAAWLEAHRREMHPPIRGVVHAAGVVAVAPALDLTREALAVELAAKVQGARALDRLFDVAELDAFVLFSSASSILPSPGLAAYAAANSSLDAIAAARCARGGRAMSIQWGAWAGGGMAEATIAGREGARAAETLDPEVGLRLMGELWNEAIPTVAVLPIDWAEWSAGNETLARMPFLSELTQPREALPVGARDLAGLAADAPAERRVRLLRWLTHQVAQVLRISEVALEPRQPLTGLGLDSLMALEIRNRMLGALGVAVPLVELIRGASLEEIASAVEKGLARDDSGTAVAAVPASELTTRDWPLSRGQQALWLIASLQPRSASYHVAFSARVCSAIDTAAMRRAWRGLRERHATLRMQWASDGPDLVQRVRTAYADSFEVSRVELDEAAFEAEVLAAYRRPFDLAHGEPARLHLFTRGQDDHVLLLVAHHIACDGWSLWILVDELRQLYAAECAGRAASLEPPSHSYIDFVRWEESLVDGPEGERQWQYWRERLSGDLPALDLPADRSRPAVSSGRGESLAFDFPQELRRDIERLARDRGVTVFTVLAAGLSALLHRYSSQEDILIGVPAAGRSVPAFANVVGHCVNQVVLRADLSGEPSFAALLDRSREALLGAMAVQDLPFPVLVQRLRPDRDPGRSPLFQVNFVFQQAQQAGEILDLMAGSGDAAPIEWGALALRPHRLHQQEGQFDLTVELLDTGEALRGLLKYDPDLFDEATIGRMAGHYRNLLTSATHDPHRRVSDLAFLAEDERLCELAQSGGTGAEWPATQCLQQRFEEAVRRGPEAVALVCDGRGVSYGELNVRANRIAARLRRLHVGPEVLVALFFEAGVEMVVAILAVLKAGAAYLPLDAAVPDDRLAFMLQDSGAPVLLTGSDRGERLAAYAGAVVDLDRDAAAIAAESGDDARCIATPANIAYCIYTSGTTGRPKGVLVEHRQVMRLFDATRAWFTFGASDTWTLFHSYAFDFSVWEIWGALLHGGRLVIVPRAVSRAPEAFHALLVEQGVTVLNQTPSAFRELIVADQRAPKAAGALRLVIFGGETLEVGMLERWIARHGGMPHLVNMYGITETTVHVTYAPIDAGAAPGGPNRIGVPIPDLRAYVLDARMEPLPAGVRGELYVGGAGLARGYLGRPRLTAERFVPDPFGATAGARLYRTGDLARRRADGGIEYLGRIDRQVKIRGFRIERGEIEAALRGLAGVRDAIVSVRRGATDETALVAYATREPGTFPGADALRAQLRSALPEYMVPSAIHVVDAFPLTANGKVDEEALAVLGSVSARGSDRAMPASVAERAVAAVWHDVLGIDDIGLHDNFFDLGGHSLLIPRVHREIESAFATTLSVVELFRHSTVATLAARLEGAARADTALHDGARRAELRARRSGRARRQVTS